MGHAPPIVSFKNCLLFTEKNVCATLVVSLRFGQNMCVPSWLFLCVLVKTCVCHVGCFFVSWSTIFLARVNF